MKLRGEQLKRMSEKAGVSVSDEEVQRALFETVRRFPANQQQEAFDFYRNNPNAITSIRAPLFEEKVIDHLLGQISVTDKKVSKDELMADDEAETEAKPAKKAAPKKARKADEAKSEDAPAEAPKKKAASKKKADDAE